MTKQSSTVAKRMFFRYFWSLGAGAILLAMLASGSPPVAAALHIDTSYQGRFRGSPTFEKILADLPFVYQEAFQKINRSLGIPIRDHIQVIVVFSDHLTHNGYRLRGKRRSVQDKQGNILHYVYLDLEFLVEGQATLLEEMTHELTHALMADIMGLAEYDSLPMWIKEGTAVHAADQGLARIKALTRRGFDLAKIGVEDESDGNPISLEKYVENYLKIKYLVESFGNAAFHQFILNIMKSRQPARELANCFNGLSEEVMNRYSQDFIARTLVDNARPQHAHELFVRGVRFFDQGEYLSARLALTEALYGRLPEEQFQKAAYLLAECYIQERNPQSAFALLKRIRPDSRIVPVDRFQFLSAYANYAMGMTSEAYIGFRQAFEMSSNPAVKEGALYYLVRILAELGNPDEAIRVLQLMQTQFPQSAYIALAARNLAEQ